MAITIEQLPQSTRPTSAEPTRHSGSPRASGIVDMGGYVSSRPSGAVSTSPPRGTSPDWKGPVHSGDEMGYNRIVKVISAALK